MSREVTGFALKPSIRYRVLFHAMSVSSMNDEKKLEADVTLDKCILNGVEAFDVSCNVVESMEDETNISLNLSKNQLKKRKRMELMEMKKLLKRQTSREKKKMSPEKSDISYCNEVSQPTGTLSTPDLMDKSSKIEFIHKNIEYVSRKEDKLKEHKQLCSSNFSVILDCSFEDMHLEGPLKSLCQQIMFCYGFNRTHKNPVSLYVTGIGEKSKRQLSKSHYTNWAGVDFYDNEFTDLSQFVKSRDDAHTVENISDESGSNTVEIIDKKKILIYLTSDAEETIETLDPSHAYIIGGIVDRNKYKGLTHRKALSLGIRTAKLPIKEHMKLQGSHILTINHVFEILLNYATTKSWCSSLDKVLPERKKDKMNSEASLDDET